MIHFYCQVEKLWIKIKRNNKTRATFVTVVMYSVGNLILSATLVIMTMFLGSYFTMKTTTSKWYDCIKPWYTPPSVVFPVAWTILYVLLFLFLVRTLDGKKWVKVFLLVMVLIIHVVWCNRYFGEKQVQEGFWVIVLLNVVNGVMLWMIVTSVQMEQDRNIELGLYVPHVAWILFATLLNYGSLQRIQECT